MLANEWQKSTFHWEVPFFHNPAGCVYSDDFLSKWKAELFNASLCGKVSPENRAPNWSAWNSPGGMRSSPEDSGSTPFWYRPSLHTLHDSVPLHLWDPDSCRFGGRELNQNDARFSAGPEASLLLQPFRKPKRIRTAFSPSQLLRLEHAFEKNHYVVGQERKDLASNLNLTETQVSAWTDSEADAGVLSGVSDASHWLQLWKFWGGLIEEQKELLPWSAPEPKNQLSNLCKDSETSTALKHKLVQSYETQPTNIPSANRDARQDWGHSESNWTWTSFHKIWHLRRLLLILFSIFLFHCFDRIRVLFSLGLRELEFSRAIERTKICMVVVASIYLRGVRW